MHGSFACLTCLPMISRTFLSACFALLSLGAARADQAAPGADPGAPKPGASYPGMPTGTNEALHKRFAQMRKDDAQKSYLQAQQMIARAEGGGCGERARRSAPGYREVLASIGVELAKGDELMATYPPMAAVHYKRADGMTQRLLQGAAGAGCAPE
jgi:hypothetical protein